MLFVVLGASGGGKSVALNGLVLKHPQVAWYDFDAVGVPPDADKKWRQRTTERWLKMALEHQSHGQDMGLCGPRDAQRDRKRWRVSRRFWGSLDLECLHKWVILHMTPTALLSYLSCQKHERARASSTLLEGFDPAGQ